MGKQRTDYRKGKGWGLGDGQMGNSVVSFLERRSMLRIQAAILSSGLAIVDHIIWESSVSILTQQGVCYALCQPQWG